MIMRGLFKTAKKDVMSVGIPLKVYSLKGGVVVFAAIFLVGLGMGVVW